MQSSINSLSYQWKDKDAEVKGIFLSGKEYHDGFANGPLPAVMMYVITDNSFDAKLFGAKTEDFFQEYRVTGGGYTLTVSHATARERIETRCKGLAAVQLVNRQSYFRSKRNRKTESIDGTTSRIRVFRN